MSERTGKRRLYLDETIWIALALEGEMREAIKLSLKRLLQDDWIILSSAFALNRLIGLETNPATFIEYTQLMRRICAEIEPLEVDDLERSSLEILSHQCNLTAAIHLTLMKRMRCDGVLTLSPEIKRATALPAFHPTDF